MKLTVEQINSFKELGYVFIENVFDTVEVSKMNKELPRLYSMDKEQIQREKDGKAVRTVLRSINADNIPEIIVFNKLDRGQSPNHMFEHPNSVQVSAKTGEGVEKMIDAIGELLRSELQVYELKIPFSRGDVIAQVHREGQVLSETTEEDNLTMRVRLDAFAYERLKKYRKTMKVT